MVWPFASRPRTDLLMSTPSSNHPVLLFSAFEPSGDNHAAPLIAEVRRRHPEWRLLALGGPKMERAGAEVIAQTTGKAAMGLSAISKAREVRRFVNHARDVAQREGVTMHIPVDSPAANFPLCKRLRPLGVKIVHLVAPQLWAWAPWRIRKLRRLTDHVLCLLPFEEEWFRARGVDATFIGHPAINRALDPAALDEQAASFTQGHPRLGVFPGSRPHEVAHNLDFFLETVDAVHAQTPALRAVIAAADPTLAERINKRIGDRRWLTVEVAASDAVIRWCDCALAVSGTISFDLTRQAKPLVGVYLVARWGVMVSKMLLTTPHRLLPNIVAGREVVPEFVPYAGETRPVVEALSGLVRDEARRRSVAQDLKSVRAQFDGKDPAGEGADVIERVLRV